MGAWGSGIFENDTACDFAATVAAGRDLSPIEDAFGRVLASAGSYLEAPEAEEALAGAEIIARLLGRPGERTAYSEDIDAWIETRKLMPPEALVAKARQAITRVLSEPSELLELWRESEDFDAWRQSVEETANRL